MCTVQGLNLFKPLSGLWQDAQALSLFWDKIGSKNSFSPNLILASVNSLYSGKYGSGK